MINEGKSDAIRQLLGGQQTITAHIGPSQQTSAYTATTGRGGSTRSMRERREEKNNIKEEQAQGFTSSSSSSSSSSHSRSHSHLIEKDQTSPPFWETTSQQLASTSSSAIGMGGEVRRTRLMEARDSVAANRTSSGDLLGSGESSSPWTGANRDTWERAGHLSHTSHVPSLSEDQSRFAGAAHDDRERRSLFDEESSFVAPQPQMASVHSDRDPAHSNSMFRVMFEPMVEFLTNSDSSFEADKCVCQLIESGVRTLIGPLSGASIAHVQSICDNMELPYFQLRPFIGSPSHWSQSYPHILGSNSSSSGSSSSSSSAKTKTTIKPPNKQQAAADLSIVIPNGNERQKSILGDENYSFSSTGPNDNAARYQDNDFHESQDQESESLTLNLSPPSHLLTSAYIDLIYAWNWSSFAIVYEHESSMIKLQDLFRESSGTWTSRWKIKLFRYNNNHNNKHTPFNTDSKQLHDELANYNFMQFDNNNNYDSANETQQTLGGADSSLVSLNNNSKNVNDNQFTAQNNMNHQSMKINDNSKYLKTFRDLFWDIMRSGEQNIILDIDGKNLEEALKQAQQVGCMTDKFSYLITSLDLHLLDLENFKYGRTRITALSLLNLDAQLADHDDELGEGYLESGSDQSSIVSVMNNENLTFGKKLPSRINHLADERYLEELGIQINGQDQAFSSKFPYEPSSTNDASWKSSWHSSSIRSKLPKLKLSPSIVLDRAGSFMDPPSDAFGPLNSARAASSSHTDSGGLGLGGQATHHSSGYQVASSRAEDELFHLLVNNQPEMRNLSKTRLSTTSAILHDSILLLALGVRELDPNGSYFEQASDEVAAGQVADQQGSLSCALPLWRPWRYGSSLINYMRRLSFDGLSGRISFNQRGLRSAFKLNVLGMASELGLVKVGEWHSSSSANTSRHGKKSALSMKNHWLEAEIELERIKDKIQAMNMSQALRVAYSHSPGADVTPSQQQQRNSAIGQLRVNRVIFERLYKEQTDQVDTLIVTTKLSQPYFMLKETPNKLEGNDQYEGFAVDLIHELSKLLNFRYRWREVADKKYGIKELLPNGTIVWNGMIGEIVRGQADLAIVDLTITSQREEAVDFTLPFMNTGISILFKKPTTKVTTLYSFLSPFSRDVWAYVLVAYCGISAILFFVGHLSPYEWANPHPCPHLKSDDLLENVVRNQFSLPNSFWFTIGSLMQQGSDLTPRSMSTRTIAGIWYFFTLIMISSYTANLAAFLTVEKVVYPIENVRDLANQQEIRYGCVESGSTCTFFKESQIDTYKRINETMHKFKSYLKSNDEGQKRVEEGKFAFFMESTSIEYIIERNCNLTQIGGLLDSKGYGLATSKKSRLKRPYRTLLSEGILHLQETGMLHVLKNRWWKERRGGGTCTDDGKGGGVTELSLANVGGVFVVLVGGLCLAFMVAMGEFLWRSKRNGLNRNSLCDQMMNDLTFALNCTRSVKILSQQERLAKRQRSLTRLSSSQRSQSQSGSQSQLNSQLTWTNSVVQNQNQQQHQNQNPNQAKAQLRFNSNSDQKQTARKPLVGFSTSEELETPDEPGQPGARWAAPRQEAGRLLWRQTSNESSGLKQQQQQQQQRLLFQQDRAFRSAQLQHHQQHHSFHSQNPTRALITSRVASVNNNPTAYQTTSTVGQQQPARGGCLANDFAAASSSSQRRRLFAHQTVDTIDDGLVWQQH